MKKKILAATTLLALSISGMALAVDGNPIGEKKSSISTDDKEAKYHNGRRHPRYRYPQRPAPRRYRDRDDRVVIATTCAPEVLNGNIDATERVLSDLATSPDFASAQTFQGLVASIQAENDVQKKVDAYFDLVGVETTEDMAYFVGARDEELRDYAAVLAANADLSQAQAERVASKLATSLRGGLR